MLAVAAHIALPDPPAPGSPGPFSFADPERVCGILAAAGFEDARTEPLGAELRVGGGGGLAAAVDFLLSVGPASAALREADAASRAAAAAAVREAIRPFARGSDVVMDAAVWVCSARRR